MKNKFNLILVLTIFLLTFNSCSDNIDKDPFTALNASSGFKTKQDIEAALLGSYNALQNANYQGLRYWALADLYAGSLSHTGTFPSFAQFATKSILANNVEITNMWNSIYVGINRANTIIAFAPDITDPSFLKENTIGEARVLRAYHYMNLLTAFGGKPEGFNKGGVGVPVFTTPTLTPEDAAPKPRSSEADVWKLIIEDLDYGIANLRESNGIGRINKFVALSLKARAHLFRNEWPEAEGLASTVFNTSKSLLVSGADYSKIYSNKNSSETIWELQFDINNTNSIAFFYYPAASGGRNEITSSTALNGLHEASDVRKPVNVTTAPANKTLKYTKIAGDDNVQLVRITEMHLIKAEALARQNKNDEALTSLNTIRNRAGLPNFTSLANNEVIDAILKERIIEFAHEGLRWFDIRRTGTFAAAGITQSFRTLWPIPEREVDTSAKVIAQNDGY